MLPNSISYSGKKAGLGLHLHTRGVALAAELAEPLSELSSVLKSLSGLESSVRKIDIRLLSRNGSDHENALRPGRTQGCGEDSNCLKSMVSLERTRTAPLFPKLEQ